MSLQPKGATRSVEEQDRREYATQVMFRNIYSSLPKEARGRLFGIRKMREIREQWGLDFSTSGFTASDFNRLGEVLPADKEFDNARQSLADKNYVKETIAKARKEYDASLSKGLYPVMLLDPQLQGVQGIDKVASFYAYTRDRSLRSIDPGQGLSIYGRKGNILHQAQQQSRQNQQRQQAPEPEYETDGSEIEFVGWTSVKDYSQGLDHLLGAYFTQADQEKLRKHFDGDKIQIPAKNAEFLDNSLAILKYLRSNGIDFEVEDFYTRGQIDVKLAGTGTSVRVFDLDDAHPGRYIGRLYDSFGFVHVQANQQFRQMDYTPEESLLPLKLMLGHVDGEFQKGASNANTQVHRVEGLSSGKHIFIGRQRHQNRYDSIIFLSDEEATDYLEKNIAGAQNYFESQFKVDELNAVLGDEEWLENQDLTELEGVFTHDLMLREKQEAYMNDVLLLTDVAGTPLVDEMLPLITSFDASNVNASDIGTTREEIESFVYNQIQSETVGTLEDGFNPAFVIDHAPEDDVRHHTRNATMAALRHLDYDLDKLKGNAFATQNVKDNLVKFDEETARTIDEVDDPFLKNAMLRVQENLDNIGVIGADKKNPPEVLIDDQGVIRWEGHRTVNKPSRRAKLRDNVEELSPGGKRIEKLLISGEIGQVFSPNENGIIKTSFASGEDYGFIPGYTGYFKFDGEYTDDRMDRFRVKGFEQHLNEKIDSLIRQQVSRPLKEHWGNIPNHFDASELNTLYHGDVYGRRVDLDFVETSMLKPEVTEAIVTSLSNRVRFGNEYGDHATTNAEARAKWDAQHEDQAAFSYWKASGETNLRVLDDDLANIADLTMTGNARTQGLTWYLVDGAKVNTDGTVTRSAGTMNLDGTIEPDKTAIRKLEYFQFEDFNAWDRVQMSANQILTAVHVDEGVGTALTNFGGWTHEDSFVVSKEFAERNKVFGHNPNEESMRQLDDVIRMMEFQTFTKEDLKEQFGVVWSENVLNEGRELQEKTMIEDKELRAEARKEYQAFLEEHGRFRPLVPGDKLSDFGGNKGTIGIVIDRHMSPEEAKAHDLEREVAIMKANPGLDVIGAPYPPLSRFNSGILRELQNDEITDMVDPTWNNGEGRTLNGAIGKLNFIVTDLTVDEKTHAYDEADVAAGRGRLASGQLAWALQSHNATDIMTDIYGHNDGAWATYREYLIATGLDMEPDGTLRVGYQPHDYSETRKTFHHSDYDTPDEFLNEITDQGGFLEVPFEMKFMTGETTNKIPILSASLRQDTELVDGTMRRSDFNNHYTQMFKHIKEYVDNEGRVPYEDQEKEAKRQDNMRQAKEGAQKFFDNIQTEIKERQFDGGHNGKHSFIRDKIMGVRMKNSATGVAIADPRLSITETSMDSDMMNALNVKEGDSIPVWRDPVWRKSAISAQRVVHDETRHGFGVNPAIMVDKDGDLDGDTLGAFKVNSKAGIKELESKLGRHNNLLDTGSSDGHMFLPTDQDFASAAAEARELGDDRLDTLRESIEKNARSSNEKIRKKAVKDIDEYIRISFREHGFGSDHIDLTSRETVKESLEQIVERGAKGNPKKLKEALDYYDGNKTRTDAKNIQYAKGVQTDDTGLGGAVSQQLVSALRNHGIDPALEVSYPVTQSILQIKHDAEQAKVIDGFLRKEIPNLYKGHSSDGKVKNVTKNKWVDDYYDVLTNKDKLGVDVSKELVEAVADVMVGEGTTVRNIKEVVEENGSPMDQIAYGGGWKKAYDLAKKGGQSLVEGEMTQYFAPLSIRNQDGTAFMKADVRDKEAEEKAREAYEMGVKRDFKQDLENHREEQLATVGSSVDVNTTELVMDDGPVF